MPCTRNERSSSSVLTIYVHPILKICGGIKVRSAPHNRQHRRVVVPLSSELMSLFRLACRGSKTS